MMITKEEIEKQLGYEITDFKIDPVLNSENEILGYSVRVVPKKSVEFIDMDFKIIPSSRFTDL